MNADKLEACALKFNLVLSSVFYLGLRHILESLLYVLQIQVGSMETSGLYTLDLHSSSMFRYQT